MTASGVSVRFDDVFKAFDETVVLAGVSLTVDPGEIFALLGPSGSGKTTMLRLLAGFEQLDRGRLLIADETVEHLPPARRGVGMLFQSYALFPHLSVAENV
ncbi:MAG: ATP-binding cassette domain-containing protein, partial [Acidobacteria bacterium]|nr:ATP-binding cassette domain-containing protein [Acidobacteriota bacterium]